MRKKVALLGISALIATFSLSACSSSSDEASSSTPINTCETASNEDLNNINEGMKSAKYRVESGFTAEFSADDVAAITQVFPSYSSPKIFAASIPLSDGESVIGLWGIQKFDYGWRITALNNETKKYSNLGADISEGSATGRVNAVMLERSVNTKIVSCLQE